MHSRSPRLFALIFLLLSFGANAQSTTATAKAPKTKAIVILESMGNLGMRIADGGAIAGDVMNILGKRLGYESVVYQEVLRAKLEMRKKLGPNSEMEVAAEEIDRLKAAIKYAPFRLRARMGKSGKRKNRVHHITLTCRKKGSKKRNYLQRARFEAPSFQEARAKMQEALPKFCPELGGVAAPPMPVKEKKGWTLPPRRK